MRPSLLRGLMAAVAAVSLLSALSAFAQREAKSDAKSGAKAERISGVITKVEEVKSGAESGSSQAARRVTINTAAVWRDWVRDQATQRPTGSTEKAAAKGRESIATKGEPKSEDTLVVVEVPADARLEMRYRSSTDAVSEGAATPEGAAEAEKGSADTKAGGATKGQAKAVEPAALKSGLWVDIEARHTSGNKNLASKVCVIRPVGGPDTPAGQEKGGR